MSESVPSKRCTECGEAKPLSEFYRNHLMPDGLLRQCKLCVGAKQKAYKAANPEKVREWARGYARRAREANPEKVKEAKLRWRQAARDTVLAHYGQVCACCSTTERLTIDHVNGDGAEHRKELFGKQLGGTYFYRWLIKNDFPPGYAVLCQPCNKSKDRGPACRLDHSLTI